MAKQSIGLGSTANDGTGDSLRVGGDKINDNFDEIFTTFGDGSTLTPFTTGTSTLTNKTIKLTSEWYSFLKYKKNISEISNSQIKTYLENLKKDKKHWLNF